MESRNTRKKSAYLTPTIRALDHSCQLYNPDNIFLSCDLTVCPYSSWPTIPQVYVNGEFVGGCDIMLSMHQSGELEKLLLKEGLVEPEVEENPRA